VAYYVGDPDTTLGWASRTYGNRQACTAVELSLRSARADFDSELCWGEASCEPPGQHRQILDDWGADRFENAARRLVT
jgi:hypothetical protein